MSGQRVTPAVAMSHLLHRTLKQIGRKLSNNGIDPNMLFSVPTMSSVKEIHELTNPLRTTPWTSKDHETYRKWVNGMKVMARIGQGIPPTFRCHLWLILANRAIQQRKLDWPEIARICFNEKSQPDDVELDTQIVKDLSRTGCNLFSEEERENQAKLKQVLLAYARFNKSVGYCQGFNMLAALILEVMGFKVHDSLKVMIYLVEEVLPESYYANNLRGLSVDMAVFRDLLRLKLSDLARHLERLQSESWDYTLGANYEPPLVNVFTMQWFLTIFANTLPKSSVLRIWDLIFLEGNEVILRTALTVWDCLADRTLAVETADEFYSIMAVLTREMMEFGITDTSELVSIICNMEPFPFPQLETLRENYIYNIRPLSSSINQLKKGLVNVLNTTMNIIDEDQSLWRFGVKENWIEDQFAVATFTVNNANGNNRSSRLSPNRASAPPSPSNSGGNLLETIIRQFQMATSPNKIKRTELKVSDALSNATPMPEIPRNTRNASPTRASVYEMPRKTSLATDVKNKLKEEIDDLKKQYIKLKQRQIQAELILEGKNPNEMEEEIIIEGVPITLKTNVGPHPNGPTNGSTNGKSTSFSMSTLLNGKTALVVRNRMKKDSMINQALPRAFLNQFSTSPNNSANENTNRPQCSRSNTITSLVTSALSGVANNTKPRASSDGSVAVNMGASGSAVKIQVNGAQVVSAPGPDPSQPASMMGTCSVMMVQPPRLDGAGPAIPSGPPPPPMISARDVVFTSQGAGFSAISREAFRRHTKSSSSSTSTELCDEVMGASYGDEDGSDLDSDLPVGRYSKVFELSNLHSTSYEADQEDEAGNSETETKVSRNQDNEEEAHSSLKPDKHSLEQKQHSEESSSADDVINRSSFSSAASSTITSSSSGSAEKPDSEESIKDGQETDEENDGDGKDLDECIRKFQYQIMRIKMEQSIN